MKQLSVAVTGSCYVTRVKFAEAGPYTPLASMLVKWLKLDIFCGSMNQMTDSELINSV